MHSLTLSRAIPFSPFLPSLSFPRRYIEALPRAQSECQDNLQLIHALLEGIQDVILADVTNHQGIFYDGECFLQLLNLLNEDFSGNDGPELCNRVLETLGHLLGRNAEGVAHFESTVGWKTLEGQSSPLHSALPPSPPPSPSLPLSLLPFLPPSLPSFLPPSFPFSPSTCLTPSAAL